MKRDLVLQTPDGDITAANAAALSGKLCQLIQDTVDLSLTPPNRDNVANAEQTA